MTSLLTFLYISGRKNVVISARRDVLHYTQLFTENAKSEIANRFLELSNLQYQIEKVPLKSGVTIGQKNPWRLSVEQFLAGYARKYRFLLFKKGDWDQYLLAKPVKIFGGEIRIRFDWIQTAPVPSKLLRRSEDDSAFWKVSPKNIISQNRLLYLRSFSSGKNNGMVIAAVSSDVFPEQIIQNLKLPNQVSALVTESNGLVLFSPRKSDINRFLSRVRPEIQRFLGNSSATEPGVFFRKGSRIFRAEMLSVPPFRIIFEKNISPDFEALNATLLRMILFAVGILLLVLAVVWFMAKRMTDTLENVSAVATRVAEGDFSQKIAIRRQDELGTLIDTFNDMIDRTRASYQSLQEVNRKLSEKVDELTRTRAELSQKQRLAIIGETVSKISHEIQNKIGGVSIWLQNLEMELKENPAARAYIEEMKSALRSFLEMLTHFKRFYREPQLEKKPVLISSVLESVLKQFSDEIRGKGLKIERKESKGLQPIWADPQQLEEAFLNILINAIYYSPPGGRVTIDVRTNSDWVFVSFSDEGPGIPKEHAHSLFQPFFTTKSSGSGLGLAIADSIVRAHGGKISFRNVPEGGAEFKIQLPIENKTAANA